MGCKWNGTDERCSMTKCDVCVSNCHLINNTLVSPWCYNVVYDSIPPLSSPCAFAYTSGEQQRGDVVVCDMKTTSTTATKDLDLYEPTVPAPIHTLVCSPLAHTGEDVGVRVRHVREGKC